MMIALSTESNLKIAIPVYIDFIPQVRYQTCVWKLNPLSMMSNSCVQWLHLSSTMSRYSARRFPPLRMTSRYSVCDEFRPREQRQTTVYDDIIHWVWRRSPSKISNYRVRWLHPLNMTSEYRVQWIETMSTMSNNCVWRLYPSRVMLTKCVRWFNLCIIHKK